MCIAVHNIYTCSKIISPRQLKDNRKEISSSLPHTALHNNILSQIEKGNIIEGHLNLIRDIILKRYITDGDDTYETIVIPRTLTPQILQMAHDELGHNGTHRTYIFT